MENPLEYSPGPPEFTRASVSAQGAFIWRNTVYIETEDKVNSSLCHQWGWWSCHLVCLVKTVPSKVSSVAKGDDNWHLMWDTMRMAWLILTTWLAHIHQFSHHLFYFVGRWYPVIIGFLTFTRPPPPTVSSISQHLTVLHDLLQLSLFLCQEWMNGSIKVQQDGLGFYEIQMLNHPAN